MLLLDDGRFVDDPWLAGRDDGDLASAAPLLIDLGFWERHKCALSRREAPLGLRLASAESPELIVAALDRLALIALEFPVLGDGRAYSQARMLRQRHAFGGEIRAVGKVQRDQLAAMRRCGFDSFEVPESAVAQRWGQAFSEITVFYQPAAAGGV